MATEAEDITCIKDEEVLRRMVTPMSDLWHDSLQVRRWITNQKTTLEEWQGTEDFARKKEIRARMYKLREQRLKEFYTTGEVLSDVQSVTPEGREETSKTEIVQIITKHSDPSGMTLTDSIEDQGFMALKSKEIRDSESPTRDIQIAQSSGDGNAQSYWKVESSSDSYQAVGSGGQYEVSSQSQRRSMAGENDQVISDVSTSAGSRSIVDKNGEMRILTDGRESFGDSTGRNLVTYNTLNNGDVMMRNSDGSSRGVSVTGKVVSSHQSSAKSQQSQKWSSSTSSSSSSKVTSSSYTTDGMMQDYADKKVGDVWEEKGADGVTRTVRVVEKVEGKGGQGGVTKITKVVKTTGSGRDFADKDSRTVRTTTVTKTIRGGHGDQWDSDSKSSTNVIETSVPSTEDYWIEDGSGGTRRVITKIIRTTGLRGDGNYLVEDGSGGTVVTERIIRTIGRSGDDVQRVNEESSRVNRHEESRTQTVDRKTSSSRDVEDRSVSQTIDRKTSNSRDVEDRSVTEDRKTIDNERMDASTKLIRNEQITSRTAEEKRRKTIEMERKGFVVESGRAVTEAMTSDRQITDRAVKESDITDDTRQYVTKFVQEEKGINKIDTQTRRESVKIDKEETRYEPGQREESQKPGSERKPSSEQPRQDEPEKTPQKGGKAPGDRPHDREPERTTDKPGKAPQRGDIPHETHTIHITRDTDERVDIQTKRTGDTPKDTRGRKPEDDDRPTDKRPRSPDDDKAPRKDRPGDDIPENKTDTDKKPGSYTTTYQWSFTPQKINVEVSASHAAFASSLRAPSLSPDRPTSPFRSSSDITYTCGRRSPTKSTSRSSLDRTTPTPRKSYTPEPNKSNRISPGKTSKSPTSLDQDGKPRTKSGEPRPGSPSKKASPVTIDGRPVGKTPKDTKAQPKDKRKSPGSRKRSGTPGVSPTTSPERDTDKPGRPRTTSSSSESSRLTYNRDVKVTKEEKYRGVTDFIQMEKDREPKSAPRAPGVDRLREKSPEYSSDGSLVQELYPKKAGRHPSPLASPDEKGFKPIRPEDDSKPRRPQSSSSSPSTSPERKMSPEKKGIPGQKPFGKTPSRDTISKGSPKKTPGDTEKARPERVTPDGRRVEARSSLTPDDKDRKGVPKDVKPQKEKDGKKPLTKPGEKRPSETELTPGSKRTPGRKPDGKQPHEYVTPDGRKLQKKPGPHTEEEEPEEEYPVDDHEQPRRKSGSRPNDDDNEPLQEYVTPDGRRVPKKPGTKPKDEPEDYTVTPDGRKVPRKAGTKPQDEEPEDYYTTPDGRRSPKKPGSKPKDKEPEDYYITPDGRRVPRKPGTKPGDEPEDYYLTPDGKKVPRKPDTKPGDEPENYIVTPDGRRVPRKPGTKPGDEPDNYETTPDGKRVPKKPGTRPGENDDGPDNHYVTPDGRRVPRKPGTKPGDEPEDYYTTPDGRKVPRKPDSKPGDDVPEDYYTTPDGERVPRKPGTKPEDEPDDYYTTPDGRRVPRKPGRRPGDDEPDDHYVTPDGRRVPRKPGSKTGDEPEEYYVTPDGRKVPRKPGTKPDDKEPEDYYTTRDGRRVPRKPGSKPEDEPEDYYITPDGRRVPRKPGTKPGDEPDDYYTTPDGRRVPRKPGRRPGDDEPDDHYVTPDGRSVPRKPGSKTGDEPEEYYVTPDGRKVPRKPGTKPDDKEPEDYYTTPDGRRVPRKPGSKPEDEPEDYYITPDGRRVPRKPGTKPGDEPDDYYTTPDGRRVPRKPGRRPGDDEPDDHYVTPDGRKVPRKPGSKTGDEPEEYYVTPDGRKVPRKPGTKPDDKEPEDYYTTPDGRRVPRKPGSKPGDEHEDYYTTPDGRKVARKPGKPGDDDNKPDDHYVTPDGRRVPHKPGTKPGDEPEDYYTTPDGRRMPRKPGKRPGDDDEPDDHYVTPDGRRVPRKPGTKPDDELEDYYTTPDGRRIPRKRGDEPEDYYTTPDGRRVPRKPGTKPDDEPDNYRVTPDGRKVPRKPGTRPGEDEPEDYYTTPDSKRIPRKPGTEAGDEPEDYETTPDGRRVPRKQGNRPGDDDDEPDDHYVTPDGRKVPRKPGSKPGEEPEDYYTTPDGRRVSRKPDTRLGDEPEDYYTTLDGRRVPRKPGTKPGDEPEDYETTPDGRRVPRKPGTRPGDDDDEPDDHYVTPDGRRVPRKPGSKPGDKPDDYYVTPDGKKVPRKTGTKPGDEPENYRVTPDGRKVPRKPGSKPGDDVPEDYCTTPDGERVPRKPGTKPGDEPDDYYITPDGRRVPRKPGTKPGDYKPDDHYVTPDGRKVPRKPGSKTGDEPEEYYVTPDGRKVPRKPGTKPDDKEPEDYYTTPDGRRVPRKPGSKPEDEPEDYYITPDGRRVPRKPGTKPGDEPEDYYTTPDGRRGPRKSGSKPEDEPEDYYTTPDGRRGSRKPGTRPGDDDDEPEDHYVTPDGRKVPRKPGTQPGDETEDYYTTPDGRKVPRKPGSKPGDEPEDYYITSDGRRVPRKPGTRPGDDDDEPDDHYVTPDGRRVPRKPGRKPVDEPEDYYTTPDGRRVPRKPGTRPGDEPEDYYTTPDGRRAPRKPGTRPGDDDDEPDDHYVTPDGRRVPRKPGTKPGDKPDDYYVTPDGKKVPRKPGTKPEDKPEDYYTTPDGRRMPKKPGTRPGDDEPDDHYVTPDGRRVTRKPGSRPGDEPENFRITPDGRKVPKKPGTRPGDDEPEDYYTTSDGRRVPKKPGTKPIHEPDNYRVTPDGRRVPKKPGTKPGDDEPDEYYTTPDGRRVPKKPGDKPDEYRITPDGRRVPRKKPSDEDEEALQEYVTPDGRRVPRKKPKGDEPDDYDDSPEERTGRQPYYEDEEEPEHDYETSDGRRIPGRRTKPSDEPEEYYTSLDGRRAPVTRTKPGETPHHEYVTPDGRRVTGKKPGTKPDSRMPGDYVSGVPGKKPTRPGDKESKYPGSVTERVPGSRPSTRVPDTMKAAGRRVPDHDYVTPDGRTVTGKRPIGKTPSSTPDRKPLTTRPGTTPKTTPTVPGTRSTTLPGTRRSEPSYFSPTKSSLVKRPSDNGKAPVGRPRTSPLDEPTRRAPAVPAKPYDTRKRPSTETGFGDEEPGRRSTTTRVTDFIRAERQTEIRHQQRVTGRSYEYDDEQPSDLVDDDEYLPEDKTRKQPKTTRATSGPILKPKTEPKTAARKPLPQQKSEPKMRTTYGTTPKPKTPGTPLRKEPLDAKKKPIGKTQPTDKEPTKKQPSMRDTTKPRRTTSESSEPEDELEYTEDIRYSEEERQYKLSERKRTKVRIPEGDRPRDTKGVVEYPQSPLDAPINGHPGFTTINENRVEELVPRYPDSVTEPEDDSEDEYQPRKLKGRPDTLLEEDEEEPRRRKTKKTPERDEPTEDVDDETVSVAQRVNKFIESARQAGSSPLPSKPEDITLKGLDDTINSYIENNELDDDIDNVNAVRKAKTMFENIAYSQVNTTAKRELLRQEDILSRPSVFDARKRPDTEPSDDDTQKQVPEVPQQKKPMEPEQLRRENLLKLGIRRAEDILTHDIFEKSEPGKDTFPRRKTPSPERTVGKYDTYPMRKSPVKDDREETSPKLSSPERAPSPEKARRPEEPRTGRPSETKPVTSRYPFSKPKTEDAKPTTQKPLKSNSVMSRYPFADKPKDSDRPKVNGYPSPDDRRGKQPSSRIPEDSDLKAPRLLKEPSPTGRRNEPYEDRDYPRRPSDGTPGGRRVSPRRPGEPSDRSGYPDDKRGYPSDKPGRPDSPRRTYLDRSPTRSDRVDKSPSPGDRDRPGDRSPPGKRPSGKTYPEDKTPSGRRPSGKDYSDERSPTGRRPSGRDYPEDHSPTGRRPSGKGYSEDTSPTGRRPSTKDYPDDRSPTGRRPSEKGYPDSRSPTGRQPSGKDHPDDRSPFGRRPSGKDYPEDTSPTGRRPSGKDQPDDRFPSGKGLGMKGYPDGSSPTARRPSGKEYPDEKSPTGRHPNSKDYPDDRSPGRRSSPDRSPTGSRRSPGGRYPDVTSPTGRRPSGKDYPEDQYPGRRTSPDRSPVDTRRSPGMKYPEDTYPDGRRPTGKDYPADGSRRTPSPTSKRPGSPRKDYPDSRGSPVDGYPKDRRPSGKTYPEDERPGYNSPTSMKPDRRGYPTDRTPDTYRKPSKDDIYGGRNKPREGSPRMDDVKISKFGVSLRKTTTGSSITKKLFADVGKKESELDRIFDLEVLEVMLERATGYDERRLIRQQIRLVKKMIENNELPEQPRRKSILDYDSDIPGRDSPFRKPENRHEPTYRSPKSPEKNIPDRKSPEKSQPGRFEPLNSTRRRPDDRYYTTTTDITRTSTERTTEQYTSSLDYTSRKPTLRMPSKTDIIDKSPEITSPQIEDCYRGEFNIGPGNVPPEAATHARCLQTCHDRGKVNKAVKKSLLDDETREESLTDSITSGYGIGPTDEKGMPLFGLKALRRQNKTTPDVETDFTPREEEPSPRDIKDSSGRPMFGLKALQVSRSTTRNGDKPTSEPRDKSPLKDLVNRHDKYARGNAVSQPQQHTPSRLRDTFVQNRNEEFIRKESEAEDVSRLMRDRGQSLREMIQRHESLTETDRKRPETVTTSSSFSTSTVVRSSAVRKPDGTISVKGKVIQGETISKDGEKPKSRMRTAEYTYDTPEGGNGTVSEDDQEMSTRRTTSRAVSSRSNTTESIHSRTSRKSLSPERRSPDDWPREDGSGKPSRRPISDKLSHLSRKFSNEVEDTDRKPLSHDPRSEPHYSNPTRSSMLHSNLYSSSTIQSDHSIFSRYNPDSDNFPGRRRSTTPQDDGSINRRRSSTPLDELKESLFRKSSTTHDESDTSSTLFTRYGRGGAVKALSQKFQQGAEAENPKNTASYPKAGLILRSASFKHTNGDLTPPESPAYKSSVSMEPRVGSPTRSTTPGLGYDSKYTGTNERRWSRDGETEYDGYSETSHRVSSRTVTESDGKSFLGSNTKVSGMQDIINRMKAADNEDVGFDTPEDIHARTLLNKFLGASVMMSGMEPLVKASGNASATLVSQVERQRILQSSPTEGLGSKSYVTAESYTDYDNIDHIWDEKRLRQLLDACTDYEGRRKIRARLRTVMAEKSACEDVVAAAQEEERSGDGSRSVQAGESLLPYLVEQLRTSLILESRPGPSQKNEEGLAVTHLEDSGTESGEDLRLLVGLRDSICEGADVKKTEQLNKKLLTEVQEALQKLQVSLNSGAENSLDPVTRETLLQLVTRLQSSLKLAPGMVQSSELKSPNKIRFANRRLNRQNRHTVGVTREELADARRMIQESALTSGGDTFRDTGQSGFVANKPDNPNQAGSEQSLVSYAVVKQNSADDVTSNVSSGPFKLFRPVHFNPGKLKVPMQSNYPTGKPFLSSQQIQSADEWMRNQIGHTRRLSESVPSSNYSTPNCLSPSSTYVPTPEASTDQVNSGPSSTQTIEQRNTSLRKSPSPPYKNIQYAPAVFSPTQTEAPPKSKAEPPSSCQSNGGFSQGLVHSKSVSDNNKGLRPPVKHSISVDNSDNVLEYDPSLMLFTPEQSVKIAVHKAAINKQLSQEGEKRLRKMSIESDIGSTDDEVMEEDGDISSVTDDEDESTVKLTKTNKSSYPAPQLPNQNINYPNSGMGGYKVHEQAPNHHPDVRNKPLSSGNRYNNIEGKNERKNCTRTLSEESKKGQPTEESVNRFEKRIQEIQNERKAENRQNVRSIEELQKIYTDRKEKEKYMERKNSSDSRSQLIQNVQAKYQKNLNDQTFNQKAYNPQRLNPDIRSKYENEIRKNMENDLRSKPVWSEDEGEKRRKESIKGLEYLMGLQQNGLELPQNPMDISQTESEISMSSTSTENSISHAQRLLQLATGEKPGKYYNKSSKKVKMKRANTIDIPKPLNYYNVDDDYSDYTDDEEKREACTSTVKSMKPTVPPLEPKTESDKKFLALLRQQNQPKISNTIWMKEQEPQKRNPFSEHQWGNRFSRIKTAFESGDGKKDDSMRNVPVSNAVTGARAFWKSADDSAAILKSHKDSLSVADRPKLTKQGSMFLKQLFEQKESEEKPGRLPWTSQKENIVHGSLTVYQQKPEVSRINKANVNQFSHAPMSAFRPVERKMDPAKIYNGAPAKIAKPVPIMPEKQEMPQTLPWLKEKSDKTLNSTVAKFESISSRETSPSLVLSPRTKIQDRITFGYPNQEVSPPARPINRSPSQSSFVQSRTQAFTPNYPNVKVKPEPEVPVNTPKMERYQYPGDMTAPKKEFYNPVTTYSVDVAATSTVYPTVQPERVDGFEYLNDSAVSTPEEQMAVTKVMGCPVQQQAVTVRQKTHRRNEEDDNRTSAAKSLTSMLQRFSSPPNERSPEPIRPRGSVPDMTYQKSLLPPNLPTGKSSPTSPGNRSLSPLYDEKLMRAMKPGEMQLRRPSSAESLAMSNSSEDLREAITSRLQIPVGPSQYRTSSLQDLSPQGSPTEQIPGVSSLRKSESCHQLTGQKAKRPQSLILPDLPTPQRKTPTSLTKTKSSHALSFPKQFEAVINPSVVEMKQKTVEEYFQVKKRTKKDVKTDMVQLDDNLENVDEAFDALFCSVTTNNVGSNKCDAFRQRHNQISKSISTSAIQRPRNTSSRSLTTTAKSSDGGYSKTTSERSVFSTVSSSKATTNKPISPFAKFQQLDRQNSGSSSTPSSPGAGKAPLFTFTDPKLSRSASGVKDRLLQWCQMKTKNYKNIQIENFSTSWSSGLAFCALIHHFRPEAFDYDALSPKERRKNFELAFRVAEEEAGIAPLLDVEDMVMMRKPDWKCVFTYVQSIYCRFRNED